MLVAAKATPPPSLSAMAFANFAATFA